MFEIDARYVLSETEALLGVTVMVDRVVGGLAEAASLQKRQQRVLRHGTHKNSRSKQLKVEKASLNA